MGDYVAESKGGLTPAGFVEGVRNFQNPEPCYLFRWGLGEVVVNPTDLWVTEPVPGRNILTLQTCTLPDYAQRLVVQAELIGVA